MPLAARKADFSVVSGLANYPASITTKEFAGSHARGTGALLTQAPLRFTSSKDIQNGISVDQVIANHLKAHTRLPSLEVGVSAGSATGNCEDGYSCAYLHNISWSGPTTFLPKEVSPRALWNRLFSADARPADGPDAGRLHHADGDPACRAARRGQGDPLPQERARRGPGRRRPPERAAGPARSGQAGRVPHLGGRAAAPDRRLRDAGRAGAGAGRRLRARDPARRGERRVATSSTSSCCRT